MRIPKPDVTIGMKYCTNCKNIKQINDFNNGKNWKDGKYPHCKYCEKIRNAKRYIEKREYLLLKNKEWREANKDKRKAYMRKFRHSITPLRTEPDMCEVCGNPPTSKGLHLDHSHELNKFRGWLCHYCNVAIGMAHDNPEILKKLAEYLESSMES